MKDYYQILGVSENASQQEIKQAFKKLAREYHPDMVPPEKKKEAEEKFKEINEAYSVLSDPQKRAQYDRSRRLGQIDFSNFDFLRKFFEDLLWPYRKKDKGRDIYLGIEISFKEAILGTKKEIEYLRSSLCHFCQGRGADPQAPIKICPFCQGRGVIEQRTLIFYQRKICPKCQGRGEIPQKACPSCQGLGKIKQKKRLEVEIPAGIEDGQMVKYRGMGDYGKDLNGDLYLEVKVLPHPYLERRGRDLYYQLEINFCQAALGDEVLIPALEGKQVLKIPAGIQNGETIKIQQKGIKGDFLVKIKVSVPKKLTKRQKELLEELKKTF